MTVTITPARPGEIETCAAVIAAAFVDDPVVRALIPGDKARLQRVTHFYIATLRAGFLPYAGIDVARRDSDQEILGVAAWEAPGVSAPLWRHVREVPHYVRVLTVCELPATVRVLSRFRQHRPDEPHWHLSDIAVTAEARRLGVGSALLNHRLAALDSEGWAAYLEATTPNSQRLYERFGFEVTAPVGVTDDGYPMGMLRRPAR